ncbi:hypothetical protein GPECTOR_35g902 [Gonium pectorale]|uniref:Uncharacterized protein n=1 Tax=Gonium pectorale TaxID=33097 RepID=A0A150GCA3_GONPE|nr:hypothetical protein GPECTOR_35g902 [Gonium pectorale]|eukprot:KXZ47464.1 hypothetical protein GPECTOR_35g902 [Gonium pectorale]
MASAVEAVEAEIEEVMADIKHIESQVGNAESGVAQIETALNEVGTQLQSPSVSEETKVVLLRKEQHLRTDLQYKRTKLQHLRNEEEQLRTKKEQLRSKKEQLRSKKLEVTGTPGIGKSFFLYYLLAELVALPEPPPYILWEHSTMPGEMEMLKSGAYELFMPLWSLEELLDCRAKVYCGSVAEGLAVCLYEHYGGVARYVLGVPSIAKDWAQLDDLLQHLTRALDARSIAQAWSGIGALELGPEACQRVLHIVTKDNFKLSHLDFASPWVADAIVAKAMVEDRNRLASLDVAEISAAGFPEDVYFKPVHANYFPTVDSLLRVGKTLCLFQVAVGSSKTVSVSALTDLYKSLGAKVDELDLCLYYVVHPDIFEGFQLRADTGSSLLDQRQPLAARTRVYILKGDAEARLW